MLRYDERKFTREIGRREAGFGIRRKKELEKVKKVDVRSEK